MEVPYDHPVSPPCIKEPLVPSQTRSPTLNAVSLLASYPLPFLPCQGRQQLQQTLCPGIRMPASFNHQADMPYTENSNSQPMSPAFPSTLLSPTSSYAPSRPTSASSGSGSSSSTPLTPQSPFSLAKGPGGKVSSVLRPTHSNNWQTQLADCQPPRL